jgi:AcrR family transcriptional regulator
MSKRAARRRVDAARREMYRQLIVEAAEGVFAEHGFADAKMSDIARESGIALKTLYSIFTGKVDLYRAIQRQRFAEIEALESAADADPVTAVMDRVRASAEYLLEHPNFLRTHLREGNAWAVSPNRGGPDEARLWQQSMQQQTERIRRGVDAGVFVEEDPELLTKMVTALYQVHLADWLEKGANGEPERVIARIQRHVQNLLCGQDEAPPA